MRTQLFAVLLGLAIVGGACSDAAPTVPDTDPVAAPSEDPDAPPPHEDEPLLVVDWYGEFDFELPNGWTVRHCEGDAPLICVADGDRHVGVVELGDYALPDGFDGDVDGYLAAHADDFLDGMRDDRAIGCPHLAFEATRPVAFDIGGVDGIKAEFRLVDGDGAEVERNVLYWTVHDDAHFVITAAATDAERGCLEPLGEFAPHDLEVAMAFIDRIVRDTPLPDPAHDAQGGVLADGTHSARILDMDPPVRVLYLQLVDVLSGQEAIDAARAAGEIGPTEDLPNDVYIRDAASGTQSVPVRDTARVEVFDCTRECGLDAVDLDAFLSGARRPMNGEYAIFTLTVAGGEVTGIAEIYLP